MNEQQESHSSPSRCRPLVLFGWQYFVAMPQMKAEQARQAALAQQEKKQPAAGSAAAAVPGMRRRGGAHDARSGAEGRRRARRHRHADAGRLASCSKARSSTICA